MRPRKGKRIPQEKARYSDGRSKDPKKPLMGGGKEKPELRDTP